MSFESKIEWTDATWNPIRGCNKVSPGCDNCYAEAFAERFRGVENHPYELGFDIRMVPEKLDEPKKWKKSKRIFVNSMSDILHEQIPDDYILKIFEVMNECDNHVFQVLTKRSKRLSKISAKINWTPNIWMGVSIENHQYRFRSEHLAETGALIKFISAEPLLGPIENLPLRKIDWVIVGGESGKGARKMDLEWARNLRNQCMEKSIPFFLKQLGGATDKKGGNDAKLDGKMWHQYPKLKKQQKDLFE
jgi:protein gp37